MIRFCSLSSGSSGNCIFIGTETTRLLIDAGISGAKTEKALNGFDESCKNINGLLITHEHGDHIAGAGILSRKYDIPIFATKGTWDAMNIGKIKEENIRVFDPNEGQFEIGDIRVCPFRTPHDAAEPVAYTFLAQNHKVSVATDIGHMTEGIKNHILGSELVLIESNHDINMLRFGSYAKSLKERIMGNYGHLSNDAAAEIVTEMAEKGTKTFFLGHLSSENNTPALAYETVNRQLKKTGHENGRDVFMYVARRDVPSRIITI